MPEIPIGLALSQGGARGLAHIGVLQVLQEQDIPVEHLSGTSIGAVVAAMYAESLDAFAVENRFREFIASDLYAGTELARLARPRGREASFWDQIAHRIRGTIALNLAQSRKGILKQEKFEEALKMLISIRSFNECKIPVIAVATDITWGRAIPMCTGNLIKAVMASSSIPGFFPPVRFNDILLSDGAICCPVPTKFATCSENALVIAVAVPPRLDKTDLPENALDVMIRAEEINMYHFTESQMLDADIRIYPDIGHVEWNELHRLEEAVQAGREAAQNILPELERALKKKEHWWSRMF
jgi:NTE family protein